MLPSLFNPSNDMALAANVRQYFPPQRIQQMESDLARLSRFWDEGPWGWSLATRQRYLRMGIPADQLPSDEWLAELRWLSSREFGVSYYDGICRTYKAYDTYGIIPCQARFCTSLDEVKLSIFNYKVSIIKSPWSSSGRGNIVVNDRPDDKTAARIERIIRQQGGIVVEPYYANKALDFAMEFWVEDGQCRFLGYSVFFADETGHYGGNCVESQEQLQQRIALPDDLLRSLVEHHRRELAQLNYRGPVGIDMMRFSDGRVHPCVEINFRMTMGLLALLLFDRGVRDDQLLAGRPDRGFAAAINQGRLILYQT